MDDELEKLGPDETFEPIEEAVEPSEDAPVVEEDDGADDVSDGADEVTEDQEQDVETWESEEAYLKHLGLDGYKSVDEAMSELVSLRKVKEAPQPERERVSAPVEPAAPKSEKYFPRGVASAHVESMAKRGLFTDENTAKFYRSLAAIQDETFDPIIDRMEQTFTTVVSNLSKVNKVLRDESWQRSPKWIKEKFHRADLDKVMNEYGLFDYRQAAHAKALEGGGDDFLTEVLEKASQTPTPAKKLPKFSSARRVAPSAPASDPERGKWAAYFNKDGTPNEAKADRLTPDKAEQFWGYVEKQARKAMGE